jgi:hypothetical protein
MQYPCYKCNRVLPVISEDEFFFEESKTNGVRFTTDAYMREIWDDLTENWECKRCWWAGWWDI